MTEKEKKELRLKIKRMQDAFDQLIHDPDELERIYRNARIMRTIRPCDLDKQFTI